MPAIRKKKLYFDVDLTGATRGLAFPCTQFRQSYNGDLYGGVLDDLPALVVGSPAARKRLHSVAAWFSPLSGQLAINAAADAFPGNTGINQRVYVRFIAATTGFVKGIANPASISVITTDGLVFAPQLKGSTPIGTRHFSVLVIRDVDANLVTSATVRGVLYVQRQHSIEI